MDELLMADILTCALKNIILGGSADGKSVPPLKGLSSNHAIVH